MSVTGQGFDQSTSLDAYGAEIPNASEELRRRRIERGGDLLNGRQRRIAAAVLHRADVVGGQVGALGQLLEREPEGLAPAPDRFAEFHGPEVCLSMPWSTTIGGVANQSEGVVSSRIGARKALRCARTRRSSR